MPPANAVIGPALCACSWRGTLAMRASCPACGRSFHDRVTPERLGALRALDVNPEAHLQPAMRIRLREMGLIAPAGKRPAGSDHRRAHAPKRPHNVTPAGLRVLEVADAIVTEQTRHDVAAAAARHAEIDARSAP